MSPTYRWTFAIVAATAAASAVVALVIPLRVLYTRRSSRTDNRSLRKKVSSFVLNIVKATHTPSGQLPQNLKSWRNPPGFGNLFEPAEAIWGALEVFLQQKGYTLWNHDLLSRLSAPPTEPVATGYMFSMVQRGITLDIPGNIQMLLGYQYRVSYIIV